LPKFDEIVQKLSEVSLEMTEIVFANQAGGDFTTGAAISPFHAERTVRLIRWIWLFWKKIAEIRP
jgi:hypothetical protein